MALTPMEQNIEIDTTISEIVLLNGTTANDGTISVTTYRTFPNGATYVLANISDFYDEPYKLTVSTISNKTVTIRVRKMSDNSAAGGITFNNYIMLLAHNVS